MGQTLTPPVNFSLPGLASRVLVGNRCSVPGTYFVNAASAVQFQHQTDHIIVSDCYDLEIRWRNLREAIGAPPLPNSGPSGIVAKVGLKYTSAGTGAVLSYSSGAVSVTLDADGEAVARFPGTFLAGTRIYLTSLLIFPTAPANVPISGISTQNFANYFESSTTALTDRTAAAWSSGSLTNYAVWAPISITGRLTKVSNSPRLGIFGDSISVGVGSNVSYATLNALQTGYIGFAQRALTHNYPWINLGYAGLLLQSVVGFNTGGPGTHARFFAPVQDANLTHIILALGTNDLASGRTDVQFLADVATFVSYMAKRNIKVIVCTVPPRTDASNAAAVAGHAAYLQNVNNAIKSNYGARVFDFNATLSAPGNPLLWRTDLGSPTTDGVHPSEAVIAGAAVPALAAQLPALLAA